MSRIIERIERELGLPGLTDALAERIEGSDLQSLLLEVYRRRVQRKPASALLAEYQANRFVAPCRVSPVELADWDRLAFAQLPAEFTALELSPVAVLGTCAALAPLSQDRVISTARNTEVAADPTNAMALEAALRRRQLLRADPRSPVPVHLAASQRMVRAQRWADPSLLPHFRVFALCSAGRDTGFFGFEKQSLELHIGFYLTCIRAHVGPRSRIGVALRADARVGEAADAVLAALGARFSEVECRAGAPLEPGQDYYRGFRFRIEAGDLELVDGGAVDWSSQLLGNAKERLLISGIGSERVCVLRRRAVEGS
jgi:hypothetical protein